MDLDVTYDSEPASEQTEPGPAGLGSATLRARTERFARIRAAHRALPSAASDMEASDMREALAASIRGSLQALSETDRHSPDVSADPPISLEEVDRCIDALESELLDRVDRVGFSELRTTIPKAAEQRRDEVLSLVDSLLADGRGLLDRLAKLEYLITVLSIEELDGERKITRDPVTITATLAQLSEELPESDEAKAVAVELYQAASLDGEGTDLLWHLRNSRDRKSALGLTCLAPSVLRAVVTYNTRIFNRFASDLESSRADDAILDKLLGHEPEDDRDGTDDSASRPDRLSDQDEVWDRIGAPHTLEPEPEPEASSVFESEGLRTLLEALRRHLAGTPIGSCTSERIALSLDVSRLEALERKAILNTAAPSSEDQIIAFTAVVGLLVRDIGVVQSQLAEIGIDEARLRKDWVLELDEVFGPLVSGKISDVEQYDLASKLSGIKTKHLLAPLSALRSRAPKEAPLDAASADEGLADAGLNRSRAAQPARATSQDPAADAGAWSAERASDLLDVLRRVTIMVALPCIVLLAVFGANKLMSEPSSVATLTTQELAKRSPYLTSAYRSDQGRGSLLIGRLDADFVALLPSRRLAVAREMADGFEANGVREAMLYGPKRKLLVHYAAGSLRLPRG